MNMPPVESTVFRRYKRVVWFNIAAQIAFPIASVFTPAIAAKSDKAEYFLQPENQVIETKVYMLRAGETASTVALQYNISLGELRQLNAQRPLSRDFYQLREGDILDVPVKVRPFTATSKNDNDAAAARAAALASGAGSFFSNNPNGSAAVDVARNMATGKANAEVQQWLNRFGTARVQFKVDENFSLKNSQIDLLLPIWEQGSNLLFTQGSFHRTDDRNQVNLGFGLRHFAQDYMVGGNTFFDYDLSRSHSRLGVGLEYWRDYVKLGANAYLRQSNWKNSKDFDNYEERPANGWDLRAEAYLPSYPHLGAKVIYEQYYGDEVALFSKDALQKDPYAVTAGVNYTPFPLLTVSAENRQGKSENDTRLGVSLNYELGSSLSKQLDPAAVAARRSLAGSRYDLIERNNNIILEYRKKESLRLYTVDTISGYAGKKESLGVSVVARNGLKHIDWEQSAISLNGGQVVHDGGEQYSVILPEYQSGEDAVNTYLVSAVAYDHHGNASSPADTYITVTAAAVNLQNSHFTPEQFALAADGQASQILTLTLYDKDGLPITGLAKEITLGVKSESQTKNAVAAKASAFTETSNGEYSVKITAGTQVETLVFTPIVQGASLTPATGYIGIMPIIKSLKLSGKLQSGETINASYIFDANNSDNNDRSLFVWGYRGETAAKLNQSETVLSSGVVNPYQLSVADVGKILELSVQAKNGINITGNTLTTDTGMSGHALEGASSGVVIDSMAKPSVAELMVSGKLAVGGSLTGRYVFAANNGNSNDRSTYVWGYKGSTVGAVSSGSAVTTSGNVADRPLTIGDVGQVIELSVQAKNGLNLIGNTLTVDTSMGGNGYDGDQGKGEVINPTATPSISQLVLNGELSIGESLSGHYVFAANNGDPNDASTYVWGYKDATAATVGSGSTVTTSGNVAARTLTMADMGQVIELSVQAKNSLDLTGNTLTTNTSMSGGELGGGDGYGRVIDPAATPSISQLVLNGNLAVGETLNGSYSFNANNGDTRDRSTYVWGYKGTTATTVGSGSVVTTSGVVITRTLVVADAGRVIELSVQAKNGLNVTGNTLTTNTSMSGNQVSGGDNGAVVNPAALPIVSNLLVQGSLAVGETLNGSYSFNANNSDITDRSTYVWGYKGATSAGVGSGSVVTTSGVVAARTLAVSDAGQVMELSVQAKNGLNVTGNTLTIDTSMGGNQISGGNNGAVINPAAIPVISNLLVKGKLEVGETLNGSYSFNANNGDISDRSTYVWGEKGTTAGTVASGSVVTTSGTVKTRTLAMADVGKVIELSVRAKNSLAVVGNTLTTDTGTSGNEVNGGGDNGTVIDPQAKPSISQLVLSGTLESGNSLQGDYVFAANNGDINDRSTYIWGYQGTTASAVGSGGIVTLTGKVASRPLVVADAGKIIELSVQAKNGLAVTGNIITKDASMSGNDLTSGNAGQVIDPTAQPVISDLAISGNFAVGEALSGTYTFNANLGHHADRSLYLWGYHGATADRVASSGVATETSGKVANRTLILADAGKVMELSVQAQNGLNLTGNTLTEVATAGVDAPIVISATPATDKLEKGKTINLVIEAKYKDSDVPVANVAIKFARTAVTDRQNRTRADSGNLLFNGVVEASYEGTTGSDGKLTVKVTDPNGLGVKSIIKATPEDSSISPVSVNVTFTVVTSPDSDKANMWGHMPETLPGLLGVTFKRPSLSAEYNTGTSHTTINETWGTYTQSQAILYCSKMPTIQQVQHFGAAQSNDVISTVHGWPTKPYSYRSGSSVYVESGGYEGYYVMAIDSRALTSIEPASNPHLVSCLE